jgi:hypothetical protein
MSAASSGNTMRADAIILHCRSKVDKGQAIAGPKVVGYCARDIRAQSGEIANDVAAMYILQMRSTSEMPRISFVVPRERRHVHA